MKKVIGITIICLLLCSVSSARSILADTSKHDSITVRDGSSFEKAIIITETNEEAGGAAEYKWLAVHYPGYVMSRQSLVYHKKRPYDILDFKTSTGTPEEIYFDISNFFGKF